MTAKPRLLPTMRACLVTLAAAATSLILPSTHAATNLVVWDTGSPFDQAVDVQNRDAWKAVPSDLFQLEADPLKSSSDPGYYGREYEFKGDAVVENHRLLVAFWASRGLVTIYSKVDDTQSGAGVAAAPSPLKLIAELTSLSSGSQAAKIRRCEILRHASDSVVLQAFFATAGTGEHSAVFAFDQSGIVEAKPAADLKAFRLLSPLEYGILPSFAGDDLIVAASAYPATKSLALPSGNLLLGLLKGENTELVLTWPPAKQRIQLGLGEDSEGKRLIQTIDFENDGRSLYLAPLGATGIWHREPLTSSFLEKEVNLEWRRPFPATWKTQLDEAGVQTTFAFREGKGQIWRGVPGSYNYPVWFDGDRASYYLSKKVPPHGDSLIYFVEGDNTPASIPTPVDLLKATLGRQTADAILDPAGRKLRTHHRRGGEGVRRACTCGCTEAIQAVFEAGQEVEKKEYINGALADMTYFVRRHVERIDEYRRFADRTLKLLAATKTAQPDLKPYIESLEAIAGAIPQEYNVQQENMKSLAYAEELTQKTLALAARKDSQNLSAYMDLLKLWREMGGSQDYVVARCHELTRKLFQAAGYGALTQPAALDLADQVRALCRECLRNPDGYEIWPNY